jgi:hypothetical protein
MIAGLSEESSAFLYAYDLSRCSSKKYTVLELIWISQTNSTSV